MWGWGKRNLEHPLDRVLFNWTEYDPFRVRDLLSGGVLILGRAGSGKTSSSGRTLMQALAEHPHNGMLICAAKPEDPEDVQAICRKAGRKLTVFDERNGWRFNFLDYLGQGQPRTVVQCLTTIGETLRRGEGKGNGDNAAFYQAQEERLHYNAVVPLQAAGEPISSDRMQAFILTAATDPAQLVTERWQGQYHSKVLERAAQRQKTPIEAHDFRLALDFWTLEYPTMDPKTRSNILAGVMATLHVFNTGIVREMISGETNISPDDILAGKWVLINFPPSTWGPVGSFINAGWQYLTERAILKRKAEDGSPFCTLWSDEFHLMCNRFHAEFICQARSHKGCLVALLQSVASIYAAMPGEAGRHYADALLANFSHTICHAADPVSAKWCAAKLGRRKEILYSGGHTPAHGATVWDQMFGYSHATCSFAEHYEQVLQDQAFMVGRTGGPGNGYLADAVVIKSGESFADGLNHKRVVFTQRG